MAGKNRIHRNVASERDLRLERNGRG